VEALEIRTIRQEKAMNKNSMIRRASTSILALALMAGAAKSEASPSESYQWNFGSRTHSNVDGSLVDVQVKVNGKTAPLYFSSSGFDRHYFQAYQGRNYSVVVRNNTGRRVGVLIAVDGLNVVNGERSALSRNEPMYVLDPYESATIQGWRTSLDDVRRFVFVDEDRSYAERTDQANGDMGWIRVLAFREVEPVSRWLRRPSVRENELGPQAQGGARDQKSGPMAEGAPMAPESRSYNQAPDAAPGTGWGDHKHDPVNQTQFEPERVAIDQIILRYEYAAGLKALGINPRGNRVWERDRGQLGFAQPPRW
jgi:hypothetical protein